MVWLPFVWLLTQVDEHYPCRALVVEAGKTFRLLRPPTSSAFVVVQPFPIFSSKLGGHGILLVRQLATSEGIFLIVPIFNAICISLIELAYDIFMAQIHYQFAAYFKQEVISNRSSEKSQYLHCDGIATSVTYFEFKHMQVKQFINSLP